MEQFQDLIVGGVSVAGFIILAMQALKVSGIVNEDNAGYAPWAIGGLLLVLYAVGAIFPPAAPIIAQALQAVAGVVVAVLGYFYGLKPVARALAANLSVSDLEE